MNNQLSITFYRAIGIIFSVFIILLIFSPQSQLNVMFMKGHALWSDYYDACRFLSDNNPYFNDIGDKADKAYLPISYLIVRMFNWFVDYSTFEHHTIWSFWEGFIFTLTSLVVFFHSMIALRMKWKYMLAIVLTSVFIFSIQRGNLIFISLAGVNYYFAYYKSEGIKRYVGLSMLCLAAALKVYPALFGLFLLRDKRYKDIVYCTVLTLGLVFIPFVFFEHGFGNIPQLFENVSLNSAKYEVCNYPRFGMRAIVVHLFLLIDQIGSPLYYYLISTSKVITLILTIISVVLFFFEKEQWRQMAFLALPVILFPTASHFYCGMYILIVLNAFLSKEECKELDLYILAFFVLSLMPIQIMMGDYSITNDISNLALIILWIFLCFSSLKSNIKSKIVINK